MYWHTSDYAKRDGRKPGVLAHRGFWLHDAPRLMLWCRLRGHRPVVDGYGPHEQGLAARRWVACDRCGARPDPQGNLDPEQYAIGDPYTGPRSLSDAISAIWSSTIPELRSPDRFHPPGLTTGEPTGTLGGELLIGRTFGVFSIELEIGAAGSDHTVAAHLRINPLGALYLHTEQFGAWLQRRLIPEGYDSREIGLSLDGWTLRWKLWARQGHWSRDEPKWWQGSINLDLVERLRGPKRFSYEDAAGPVLAWVHLPEGDSYQVQLNLQHVRYGRPKTRRPTMSWSVDWESDRGIPTRSGSDGKRGTIMAAAVTLTDAAATHDRWVEEACARITADLSEQRVRYGYRPAEEGSDR
ncbi:hypothetical protein ACQPYK_25380 [Streptosporangium sp. CA-135522]|uniref:hypothetical protein n=1 Tax=Streptosporangium sp. CA-135522 TaxID=3240072 RepID=UPI003D930E33